MRRARRSPLRFWGGIVLLVCLVVGLTADAFGDCVSEGWDETGSTAICVHRGDWGEDSEREHAGHAAHHGANGIWPCHGVVLRRPPGGGCLQGAGDHWRDSGTVDPDPRSQRPGSQASLSPR